MITSHEPTAQRQLYGGAHGKKITTQQTDQQLSFVRYDFGRKLVLPEPAARANTAALAEEDRFALSTRWHTLTATHQQRRLAGSQRWGSAAIFGPMMAVIFGDRQSHGRTAHAACVHGASRRLYGEKCCMIVG